MPWLNHSSLGVMLGLDGTGTLHMIAELRLRRGPNLPVKFVESLSVEPAGVRV